MKVELKSWTNYFLGIMIINLTKTKSKCKKVIAIFGVYCTNLLPFH